MKYEVLNVNVTFWYLIVVSLLHVKDNFLIIIILGLVDPGHVTIPLCNDPELLGRQSGYGKCFYWFICDLSYDFRKKL